MDDATVIADWVTSAESAITNAWSRKDLIAIAGRPAPSAVLGGQGWLVQADVRSTWARWYAEGLSDLGNYVEDESLELANLYSSVRQALRLDHSDMPADELGGLARVIASFAWSEVLHRRRGRRLRLSPLERESIWFSAEPDVRCYLCGYAFSAQAKASFLRREELGADPLPLLIDFVRPRGRNTRDTQAEVDHVRPVAGGGHTEDENLKLACGWCNRVKSRFAELYDAPAWSPRMLSHPKLGKISLPQPLWVVRVVGVRARCESSTGCEARLKTQELFLAPRRLSGSLNPLNAAVYCHDHDPWREVRFIGPELLS